MSKFLGQVAPAEMDVIEGGLCALMSGEARYLMNIPTCSRQIGEAQVTH